ncbi:unnamed protein product [Sympodiomycopsis kandeliae]
MPIITKLTEDLGLKIPLVQGGMQWVGVPQLASAVSNAGGLGLITALTQPSPEALRSAIKDAKSRLTSETLNRSKYGGIGVNITLLPSINPPDYEGYARAALEEGIRIFETAGNNPGPIIKLLKEHGAYVIHKCTQIRHARASQKMGVDCLSIDGFECAGHPGEQDIGGLVLMARAKEELQIPFIASGGIANGTGLAAALALGAAGANMGTRFMCTVESPIHSKIKDVIVKSSEADTIHIFRTLKNTARVYKNKVSIEVVEKEKQGAQFKDIQHLVSGARGRKVYEEGDPDAGIWSAGITLGLIHDIPTCSELVANIEKEATEQIEKLSKLVGSKASHQASRQSRL